MSTFADFHVNARVPARYRDARTGLRFRVVDVTEEEPPDVLIATEVGDGLLAAFKEANGAKLHMKCGNPWVSSLIVSESRKAESEDRFLMAIPHPSVMVTTPVVGAEAISGLEVMMGLCDELFDIDGTGVSPFVWWWYDDNYRRVTDLTEDGSIDFRHHTNVNVYHLARAIQHLANPCAECGRD